MKAVNEIVLEVEKEERMYRMSMSSGAPLGEAYEAVGQFMDEIIRLINEHTEKRPQIVSESVEDQEVEVEE